jgi:hypothetical protein
VRRRDLEHIIRACAQIADDDEIVVLGSQAILGKHPDAPATLLVSREADVYPKNHPDRSDLIDGSIGEGSPFDETFGYYAQGVGEETAVLPDGWKERLVVIRNANTRGATGLCLEPHDLVVSKLIAGREKDLRFARDAIAAALVSAGTLAERLAATTVSPEVRERVAERIAALRGA